MLKLKSIFPISICLLALIFISAGCNNERKNDPQRPLIENQTGPTGQAPENSDDGEVAGTEIIYLPTKQIKIKDLTLTVEVADTDESRTRGLSGRDKLDEGTGMFFDFTDSSFKRPGFWMKDMLISIDIIWINNGKIIGVQPNVPLPPEDSDLPVYYPPSDVTHVLEVPAGWSEKNNITIGETVSL